MKMMKMLQEMLKDPESELSIALKKIDAEPGCENLEMMIFKLTKDVGRILLEKGIQDRADHIKDNLSECPHCKDKKPFKEGTDFSPCR